MKALVTGATGFIGSHLADLLHERNYEVRCTIRKTSSLKWLEGKPFELVEASLSDIESLKKAVKGVDIVFHVAGLTFAKTYEDFLKGNRDGTRNLINAVLEVNPNLKRFLMVSSMTVSGPSKTLENPNTEDMECHPLTSYGKSKKAAEDELLLVKDRLPITILRPPAVYGPRDTEIFTIFKAAKSGVGTLVGMKPKYLSIVHSADLVKACVDAVESEKTIGEIYNVASDNIYNWNELMDIFKNALGKKHLLKIKIPHFIVLGLAGISGFIGKFQKKPPVFNYEKGIDFIQDYWTCSTEKAKRDFNFKPVFTVEEGIKQTADWYIENKWL